MTKEQKSFIISTLIITRYEALKFIKKCADGRARSRETLNAMVDIEQRARRSLILFGQIVEK